MATTYEIDTRTSYGERGDEPNSWGETTSATCIEHVTEWVSGKASCNGFNIFRNSRVDGEEKENLFIANRYSSTSNWWSDLHNTTEDNYEAYYTEEFFGAKLRIIGKSNALGLEADRLCGNEYCPDAQVINITSEPENLGVADQLMKKYRDGSNSWTREHL